MITAQDVELLAALLQRAGVNPYEAIWANEIIDELRAIVTKQQAEVALEQKKDAQDDSD